MINLIFNELYKIFHKKLIYILAIITVVIFVLIGILNKQLDNFDLNSSFIDLYKTELQNLNLEDPTQAQNYVLLQPMVDVYDIQKEKKFDVKGPEYFYLTMTVQNTLSEYYSAKYIEKDEIKAEALRVKKDEMLASLDNFDWKKPIQDELIALKVTDENFEGNNASTKEEIRVLEYRLNNNIPYANSNASTLLSDYVAEYAAYVQYDEDDSKIIKREELYAKKLTEKKVKEVGYKLDNNIIKNDYKEDTAQFAFTDMFATVNIFVIVCILMIAGQIVAEEYSKGTIKQLLVRPYTRNKIIVSKIIATSIVVFTFMVFLAVVNMLVTGIFTGTFNSILNPIIEYNYNTKSIMTLNILTKSLFNLLAILPEIIILILFTVLMSALVGNTALSVVLGFVLTVIPNMFSALVDRVKVLSYVFFFNWDLSSFMFGGMAYSQYLTLPKAIIVDVITIILLFVGILFVFKKKQVKNQ